MEHAKWTNWKKITIALCIAVLLMLFPLTRHFILLLLPLGSGVDDFVFFALLAAVGTMLILRIIPVKDKLKKIAYWFMK